MQRGPKLKIDVAHGSYIIDGWDDVFSLRVVVLRGEENWMMWRRLFWECERLRAEGKLDGMAWIRDIEEDWDGMVSVTRQWSRTDATRFIPCREESEL